MFPNTLIYSLQRPTAKELLQHRFIRSARKTSYLTELIERYQDYRARTPAKGGYQQGPTVRNSQMWEDNGTIRSDWNFDTVKSNAAMGTFRSMARDLAQPSVDEDEYLDEDESGLEDEEHGSVDTGAATKGSDPFTGIGQNAQASHSTMIIKPTPGEQEEADAQSLLDSGESGSGRQETNPPLCAPPAYTGSLRASRRSSYKARIDVHGAGSLLREADLGTGVDTIRPHKKVDTVGSLRLSAEFVGSLRKERVGSTPSSPSKGHKRGGTELVRAGESIIDEVVLPILQNVGLCLALSFAHAHRSFKCCSGHRGRHGCTRDRVA